MMATSLQKKAYELNENQLSQDFLISHYKSQVLQKTRSIGNYTELQLKFRSLQSEMNKLSNEHLKLKFALSQLKESSRCEKNDLIKLNEDLIKQIKEKDTTNRQLYNDNRILNYELEKKISENNKLQEELINQKNFLNELNLDKSCAEQKLLNLNKLTQNNQNDLSNLNFQINKLNIKTNEQKNILQNKENDNNNILKQIKTEKNINNDLYNVLNTKENELSLSKQKLNIANNDLNKLENDFDKLKGLQNKNNNDLTTLNDEYINEISKKTELEANNKELQNNISIKEEILKKEKEDNKELNEDIKQLELDTNLLMKKLDGYKTHIFIMSDANKNLVKELECVLIKDKEIEATLVRDEILEKVKKQNNNEVLNSRKNVELIMDEYIKNNVNNKRKITYEYEDTDKNILENSSKININNNSNLQNFKEKEENELNNLNEENIENNNEEMQNKE